MTRRQLTQEILTIRPGAVWMPWDNAPAGQRAVDEDGYAGTILCRLGNGMGVANCNCPDCNRLNCIVPSHAGNIRNWWVFRMDKFPEDPVVKYPPSLRPE